MIYGRLSTKMFKWFQPIANVFNFKSSSLKKTAEKETHCYSFNNKANLTYNKIFETISAQFK